MFDINEVAALINVHPRTLRRHLKDGIPVEFLKVRGEVRKVPSELTFVRIGSTVRFPIDQFESMVDPAALAVVKALRAEESAAAAASHTTKEPDHSDLVD